MPRLAYEIKKFAPDTLDAIAVANNILEDYAAQGYDLTLRQLFYQHVARGLIPNTERSYKRLGTIVNDARMAGYIDWDYIVDRTRNVRMVTHWDSPAAVIAATARSYRRDLWAKQGDYVEVWIEKDALVGVIQGLCSQLDVPYFSCRGYTSQSEMWAAAQRILGPLTEDRHVTILHLGDHDPSGIDMSRDIEARLRTFISYDYLRNEAEVEGLTWEEWLDEHGEDGQDDIMAQVSLVNDRFKVKRIALTMAQVRQYNPPPNPAKLSDSRAVGYIKRFGNESWELDALDPPVMNALIRDEIEALIDPATWNEEIDLQKEGQQLLRRTSTQWATIVDALDTTTPDDDDEEEDDDEETD